MQVGYKAKFIIKPVSAVDTNPALALAVHFFRFGLRK